MENCFARRAEKNLLPPRSKILSYTLATYYILGLNLIIMND